MDKGKVKGAVKEFAFGLLAERGVKAGIFAGLVNGIFFLLIYLFAGVKELPIGIFSYSVAFLFIITHIVKAAVFGLILSLFYTFLPAEKMFNKIILLSLVFWFLLKLIPYFSFLTSNPLIIIETIARYLLMGVLVLTTTAIATSPFFTMASGVDSLILTLIISPILAYFLPLRPSTPIQEARLAPVLSDTSKIVRI